ncbi:MAG: glycosyltransferase family 4 protein [Hyphomonadaceae bacterium]
MATILQITPALEAGGVERTTLEIADALMRAGHRALVASAGGRMEAALRATGAEFFRLPLDSKNPWTVWRNAERIAALARTEGAQLIHARSRAPAWSAYGAAQALKLPFVTTYHGIYNAKTGLKRLYNSIMAKGDLVIANSDYTRAHVIVEHGVAPERVISIPRGVDLDAFDPDAVVPERIAAMRAAWTLPEGAGLVVLLPARLTRWKGQKLAIEATAQILATQPNAMTLILAGDAQGRDAYAAELQALIAALGLGARVRIVGHVADMPAALMAADIALAPSLEPEAFGRSAVEAQAMGRPVIAANHGGFTETIVAPQTGLLVAPNDPGALASALQVLIEVGAEGRENMGAQGKERARRLYATSRLQEATLQVYNRLLGDR